MCSAIALISSLFAMALTAPPSVTEKNVRTIFENSTHVCPTRPVEPQWMQNIPLRDAYQRVLVQDIYRAQNLERIVRTGSCACGTRFPEWEEAEAMFFKNHVSDERWEMLQASDRYNRRAREARPRAKAICEAHGNW